VCLTSSFTLAGIRTLSAPTLTSNLIRLCVAISLATFLCRLSFRRDVDWKGEKVDWNDVKVGEVRDSWKEPLDDWTELE